MQLFDKTVIVTGGGSGIGRALCDAFHQARAKRIVVADVDLKAAEHVAAKVGGVAFRCDVSNEADVVSLIEKTESESGPVDLYCSNAGVALGFAPRVDNAAAGPDELWHRAWSINVMGHVYAGRNLIPRMKLRGGGYFLITVSAAGLRLKSEARSIQQQSTPRLVLLKILQSLIETTGLRYLFFVRRPWTHRCCSGCLRVHNRCTASCHRRKLHRPQSRALNVKHSYFFHTPSAGVHA